MEHQSLITLAPWTFIAQILNLLLQAWLFKKFLFQPVKKILAKRREEVDSLYTDAEEAKETALREQAAYTEKLAAADQEAEEILSAARDQAREKSDAMLSAARDNAAAMKEKAAADIELEKKKAVNAMKDELSTLAVEIAAKVTEREMDETKHRDLIDGFLRELEEKS